MTKRIWELDAFRGLCIIGMVLVHLLYDLILMGVFPASSLFDFIQNWGGTAFLLLSGICVTLGRRHIRRGLVVFGCGMLCSAVTAGMYLLGLSEKSMIIYFGVLHCLGCCMLLWTLFSRLPPWAVAVAGAVVTAAGFLIDGMTVDFPWLMPLGIPYPGFATSDYFPLLPNLGFFLLGAATGKVLYKQKTTRLPRVDPQRALIRFLCLCGRRSLWIYLLHQPLFAAIFWIAEHLTR